MNAQKSRGADFSSGGLIKRAKALVPLLVPLIMSSFKRAEELATAMECRCYRGDKNRTRLVKLTYRGADAFAFVLGVLFIGAIVALRIVPYQLGVSGGVLDVLFYKLV